MLTAGASITELRLRLLSNSNPLICPTVMEYILLKCWCVGIGIISPSGADFVTDIWPADTYLHVIQETIKEACSRVSSDNIGTRNVLFRLFRNSKQTVQNEYSVVWVGGGGGSSGMNLMNPFVHLKDCNTNTAIGLGLPEPESGRDVFGYKTKDLCSEERPERGYSHVKFNVKKESTEV